VGKVLFFRGLLFLRWLDEVKGIRNNFKLILNMSKNFGKALGLSSRYLFETLPRMLTLWLDFVDEVTNIEIESDSSM
jgi:hypothetical protein